MACDLTTIPVGVWRSCTAEDVLFCPWELERGAWIEVREDEETDDFLSARPGAFEECLFNVCFVDFRAGWKGFC